MNPQDESQDTDRTDGDKEDEYILIAKMDNAKNLSNVLKAVHFKEVGETFPNEMSILD